MFDCAWMIQVGSDRVGQSQVSQIAGIGRHTDITQSETADNQAHLLLGVDLIAQLPARLDMHEKLH